LSASIAVRCDAGDDEDGNDRCNPHRAGAGGRLSIGVRGGASIWIAFEPGIGHIEFPLVRVLLGVNAER
jgi:hypothetical protein